MTLKDLQAIEKLLDDPDIEIYRQIEQELVSKGKQVLPFLEETLGKNRNKLVRLRIENVIDTINNKEILSQFHVWNERESPDLFEAMLILNRIQYPSIDFEPLQDKLERGVKEIWLELNENLTAFEKVNILNRVIFDIWNFKTVVNDAYDEFHYNFLSNVMELKCGNQFSLACFYLILAEKLDLPIYPVMLEKQVILCYADSHRRPMDLDMDDILFYINPGEKGVIFDDVSIKKWITKFNLQNEAFYYLPCDNKKLVKTYIDRLIQGYEQEKESRKARLLSTLYH